MKDFLNKYWIYIVIILSLPGWNIVYRLASINLCSDTGDVIGGCVFDDKYLYIGLTVIYALILFIILKAIVFGVRKVRGK